ncbi:MAG: nucleotidyltransferase [Lactobacillus sp.]|jgi:predicted nucleotidyltransferase|nr:nucleotidyltransferase [Lactobacillus sp.]
MQESRLNACGIIAEYNPLHNGHVYQLDRARALTNADVLVVVMSGNFVQRGEIALVDKWCRTQMALDAGADLVVELPFSAATQPADGFSAGAVRILADLGCDFLAFGTEMPNLNYAKLGQAMLKLPRRQDIFVDYTKTYATQLNELLQAELGVTLTQPNLLLAASYAKAVMAEPDPMTLLPILRIGANHDDPRTLGKYSSASHIRRVLQAGGAIQDLVPYLPNSSVMALASYPGPFLDWAACFSYLKYQINTMTLADLGQIYQVTEGLEYRIKKVINQSQTFAEFLQRLKTKRYTNARLQRVCLNVLLKVTKTQMAQSQLFIHPLGFNERGRQFLHQSKQSRTLPLVTKPDAKNTAEAGLFYLQSRVDRFMAQLSGRPQNFRREPLYYRKGE